MKEYLPQIIQAILASGFLTGIYMLLKLRPEAGQITVTAAQGAIIVQTGVIDTLREELIRVKGEFKEELATVEKENEECKKNLREFEKLLRDHDIRLGQIEQTNTL